MDKVNFIIFDEEEITKTLVESYLKELTFSYQIQKFNEFDESVFWDNGLYNIVIVNISKNNLSVLEKIEEFSKNKKNKFIVVSNDNSTDLHVKVLRVGAKDFLMKPLKKSDFLYSIQTIYKVEIMNTPQKKSNSTIFVATSLDKGTGKTTFVINLAKELADASGEKVLLIDFNNTTNDISFLLDVDILMNTSSYINKLTNENAPKLLSKLARYQKSNLYVMANGFTHTEDSKVDVRNVYNAFQILKEHFKYIVIDLDKENEKLRDEVVANSDVVWVLTNPSLQAFEKIKAKIDSSILRKNVRVVLNKYEKKYETSLESFQEALGKQIYCKIPKNIIAIATAQSKMKTLKEVSPEQNIVKAFMSLAKHISQKGWIWTLKID